MKMGNSNVTLNQVILNNLLTAVIFISFIVGFFLEENSAGGGNIDELKHHWRNFQLFLNNDFFTAIKLTAGGSDALGNSYSSSRTPLIPIIQAFFISFFNVKKIFIPEDLFYFRFVIFILSLSAPIILYKCLKKKNLFLQKDQLLLLSSLILLLSPYFRTSAYWGYTENFTFIAMLLSYYFLHNFLGNEKIIYLKKEIFYVTLFSSLCVYFDVKTIIIPILCYYFILISNISFKDKLLATIYYFFLSLPFLYLFYIWGGPIPPEQMGGRNAGFYFYAENIGYASSIISFYLLPILLFKFNSLNDLKKVFLDRKVYFYLLAIILYLIILNGTFNFEEQIFLGKGILHKFVELLTESHGLKIILTYIGFFISLLILFLFLEKMIDTLTIVFLILISVISTWIFQEYYDPLILLLVFTFFSTKILINNRNLILLALYQASFLLVAVLYYTKTIS